MPRSRRRRFWSPPHQFVTARREKGTRVRTGAEKNKNEEKQKRRCLGRESASSTKVVQRQATAQPLLPRRKEKRKKKSLNGRFEEEEENVMKVRRPVGDWLSEVAARTETAWVGHCKPVPRLEHPSKRAEPDFRFC